MVLGWMIGIGDSWKFQGGSQRLGAAHPGSAAHPGLPAHSGLLACSGYWRISGAIGRRDGGW